MNTSNSVFFDAVACNFARILYKNINYNQSVNAMLLSVALVIGSLGVLLLPTVVVAESGVSASERTYQISEGPLVDALNQFSAQSGVMLSFDGDALETMGTGGLEGNYTAQAGLDALLTDSGFQAVLRGDVYFIQNIADTNANASGVVTTLPSIEVAASATTGYVAAVSTTATKTNTLLRDTPQAITVVTQEAIQDQNVQSMADAVRYVPGVGISSGEGNRDALVFRGQRTTADFFIDGVRDDAQIFRDIYNVDRIEVLKGANGMIFGRGGSGGVVNRVTKQANWNPTRQFSFQGGSFNQKRITADVGHVINDKMAVRLNGMYEDSKGFRDGFDLSRRGISPTVTIKPTHRTRVVLNMEAFHDKRTADRGITSFQGGPVGVGRSQFFGDPRRSTSHADVLGFNSTIEHRFDVGLTVRNRTNYADYNKSYKNVFASGAYNGTTLPLSAYNDFTDRENVFNQTDFIFALDTGPIKHTLLAGVEIGQQITSNSRDNGTFDINGLTKLPVTLQNSVTSQPITFNQSRNRHSVVDITSLYIQDQIELLPQLQAIVGVRYDQFKVKFKDKFGGDKIKTKDDLISPRFGLIYKPFDPLSFYTSYSKSFVPRVGEQLNGLKVTNETLSPEKFVNLEAGIKWDVRPDLALTAAVYRLDRSNVITADPNNAANSFLTKGQRTKGVELSVAGQLTYEWSVMGGYAYQHGEITKSLSPSAKEGATLAELPKHTFSMWNRYNFTPRWGAALGVIHRSGMFASTDNTVRVGDFTRLDAAVYARLNKFVGLRG